MPKRGKGHHAAEHVNNERWLLTYADLITLLMVFFVVMYSMSRADVAKFAKLQASIQRAFRVEVLRGDDSTSLRGDDGSTTPISIIQEAIAQRDSAGMQQNALVSTLDELREALAPLPQTARAADGLQLGLARDGVVISLSGNVLFDSGKADLKPDGLILLDALADRLRELPYEARVEGHTDNIPIDSPLYPTNWELSSARATTVVRYMAEAGVEPKRLIAAGYGQYRPAASNDTREGRARNRRVDIVVLVPQLQTATAQPSPAQEAHR